MKCNAEERTKEISKLIYNNRNTTPIPFVPVHQASPLDCTIQSSPSVYSLGMNSSTQTENTQSHNKLYKSILYIKLVWWHTAGIAPTQHISPSMINSVGPHLREASIKLWNNYLNLIYYLKKSVRGSNFKHFKIHTQHRWPSFHPILSICTSSKSGSRSAQNCNNN